MARTRRAELLAYHEAGHVVAALHFGIYVRMVELGHGRERPSTNVLGGPHWNEIGKRFYSVPQADASFRKGKKVLAAWLVFLWAGYCAERIAMRRWGKRWARRRGFWRLTDSFDARDYVLLRRVRGSIAYVKRFEKRTYTLLETLWPVVEAIAEALLGRRKLYYRSLRSIALKTANRHGL